mmetsp:Transcript_38692/g.93937  ORF Transcript_38692/g.93937 Transcript_38692/m.93937 type:complete len:134 (-) Transcript_38692:1262-1663(-)
MHATVVATLALQQRLAEVLRRVNPSQLQQVPMALARHRKILPGLDAAPVEHALEAGIVPVEHKPHVGMESGLGAATAEHTPHALEAALGEASVGYAPHGMEAALGPAPVTRAPHWLLSREGLGAPIDFAGWRC